MVTVLKLVPLLPDTTIIVAEFDGMRSDSEKYYQKLIESSCSVSKIVLPGQCHHTMLLRGAISDAEDPAEVIAKVYRKMTSEYNSLRIDKN